MIAIATTLAFSSCVPADDATTGQEATSITTSAIQHVFVIALENHGATDIYGNTHSAPYINNTLLPAGGRASNFLDRLPSLDSEPHYVWMEAGTNAFADHTFTNDNNPSSTNSTASTTHLTTQITAAGSTWRSYQEGLNSTTGSCPIAGSGNYAPKHDPFVFFQDVAGSPPSKTAATCVAHHKPLTALATDLANDTVAAYNFITPNLCHDMHSNTCTGSSDPILQGDTWLSQNVPAILSYINAHQGVLFIVWDEPVGSTGTIPLIVLGPHVIANRISTVTYSHGSLVKSVEQILALPTLATVTGDNTFADFFEPGFFP
ncbi:MAG TPA: alkaline phosphatase family protein [Kofleriaceae bacterium]|nr:alkaline phosphatase family protein [Kofleriaceae bacterium]